MKKFIAMLLALVMVLSLVACGDKKDDAAGTDDSDKDSQDTITLKMHFVDPETAPFVQGGKKIAELVSEATDGRIQIEVLAGGSLGGERDTVELRDGQQPGYRHLRELRADQLHPRDGHP